MCFFQFDIKTLLSIVIVYISINGLLLMFNDKEMSTCCFQQADEVAIIQLLLQERKVIIEKLLNKSQAVGCMAIGNSQEDGQNSQCNVIYM